MTTSDRSSLGRAFSIQTGGLPLVSTFALLTIVAGQLQGSGYVEPMEPEFLSPAQNMTVAQGRDVHFTCTVNHLGSYRVAWIKSDTKTILAIHTHMVTQNPRLSVTHNGHNTWKLYITNVESKDSGTYMCQINTDPMMSQMSHLSVVIPPDIADESESTAGAPEGGSVELRCTATGTPEPTVSWKRLGGRLIVFRDEKGTEIDAVESYAGSSLRLTNLKRHDMGGYLCIASNSVPPSKSRRYEVSVYFTPVVRTTSQLHMRSVEMQVTLECIVEASPKSLNTWQRGKMQYGSRLVNGTRHSISEEMVSPYSVRMNLTIARLKKADFGEYYCNAVNGYGKADAKILLKELPQRTTTTTTTTTTTSTTVRPTTTTTRLTTLPPKRHPKKPPQDRGKNINVIDETNSRQVEHNNVLLHNSNSYGPLNNTLNEYAQRSERQKVRPSGPPKHYVVYNDARKFTLNLNIVLIIITAIRHFVITY